MSGSDWPEDPSDPRCPACGEPVSATASYCMHCEEDLPAADFGPAEATGAAAETTSAAADATATSTESATSTDPAGTTAGLETSDPGMPTGDAPAAQSGWLDPDSAFDDVSTAAVGIVGGLLDGFLLLLLGVWAFPAGLESSWGFAVAVVGWLLATAWIARTRSVFGAVRKAAYSFAVLLALAPLFVAYAIGDPDALLFGIVCWPVAGIVAGVGWVAGRGEVEDGG